jgi:ketosteroid isomerase-like protein
MVSGVEQLRDAFDRDDQPAMIELLHPDVTWIGFPGDSATPICRSKEEASARFNAFTEGGRRAHPEIVEQSDVRIVVRMHLDSPPEGVDLHQVLTLRDGLVWLIEDYPERP